jgi:hypothetical protein
VKIKQTVVKIALLALVCATMVPSATLAAEIEPRSVTLGSSAASAVTTYSFSFKPGTTGNIGAIEFQICDDPVQADPCNNASGSSGFSFTSNGASIQSQSGISGFTAGSGTPPAPTANTFWITNGTPQNVNSSTTVTVTLQNVLNPSVANSEYWARISTFSNSAGSAGVDYGAEAVSTANQITVNGTMPESLVFCVGTSGTTCASGGSQITGTTVNLGTFSPASTNSGTSVMSASTNAGSGYIITVNGTTLTSGSNTIAAMGTQSANSATCSPSCTSSPGTSQFGSNVVSNTSPSVGAGVTPTGAGDNGAGFGGYDTANSFRFFNGDTVASSSTVSNSQVFTNSYIVNVGGSQAAGLYSSTLTYICTATF